MPKFFLLFLCFFSLELSARLPDLIPYRSSDRWGYCDSTKKLIIQPQYDEAWPFSGKTAKVTLKGKQMLINRNGETIYSQDSGFIAIVSNQGIRVFYEWQRPGCGFLNEAGQVVMQPSDFWGGWVSNNYFFAIKGDSMGVFDFRGRQVIGFDYRAYDFGQDANADKGQFILQNRKGKYGVIDTMARVIVPFIYEYIDYAGCGNYHAKARHSIHTLDAAGNKIRQVHAKNGPGWYSYSPSRQEEDCNSFITYYPLPAPTLVGDAYMTGYTDENRRMVIPPIYDAGYNFDENGLAPVYKILDSKTREKKFLGYIDRYGNEYWED